MILNRLVARWAAVSALTNFNAEPWPTLVGPNVFDSRVVAVEDFKDEATLPIIVVYTDYDKDHWNHSTMINRSRMLTFTFELLVAQVKEIAAGAEYQIGLPETDSELEMTLDVLEQQMMAALAADNVAADCFRSLANKYENVISRRGATVEGGQKLAARQITIETHTDRGPKAGIVPDYVDALLTKLEEGGVYAERATMVRGMYAADNSITEAEKVMRLMGWSTEAGRLIGYERGAPAMLPPTVTWLQPPLPGSPLP